MKTNKKNICFSSAFRCLCFICAKTQQTRHSRICFILNMLVWTKVNRWETEGRNGCISGGVSNYRLAISKAWVQLNAPVWASYKQKRHEPIIRWGRLQGRVWVTQPAACVRDSPFHPGKVRRKQAPGELVPSSPLFNLITVMSLEPAGCTVSNVDADKHTALSLTGSWMQSASSGWNPASLDGSLTVETVRMMDVNRKVQPGRRWSRLQT